MILSSKYLYNIHNTKYTFEVLTKFQYFYCMKMNKNELSVIKSKDN